MSYLARLKNLLAETGPPKEPTKPTKDAFVSSVSAKGGPFLAAERIGPGPDRLATPHDAEIEERAGVAADRVPALYLDAWARLNCQKPALVSEAEWRRALGDGASFLDAWGVYATALGWTPGDLFDVPRKGLSGGLLWQLRGERVEALGPDHVRLGDGRDVMRGEGAPGPQAR